MTRGVPRLAVVALVVLLVVGSSGCVGVLDGGSEPDDSVDAEADAPAGESGPDPESGTATDDEPPRAETTAEAAEVLPVDVYRTYDRTRSLVGSDAEKPRVEVWDMDGLLADVYDSRQDEFQTALNMTETEIDTTNARGISYGTHVVVDPNEGSDADVEQVLVHEYVHAIQAAEGWYPNSSGIDLETQTATDYGQVELALVEGGAVWVTDRYSERYQDEAVRLQSERLAEEYETAPAGDRFFRAPYHYGTAYVDDRIDDPEDVGEMYENPPETTEQLLHGLDPDEAPPTDLEVTATTGPAWSLERDDRLGELFVRVALESELDGERAADAATGWGNDRLLAFEDDDGDRGFVWTLHWDSATDADEFEAAFAESLEERTDENAEHTTVDRRGEETVVVTVGSEAFREEVSVTGEGTELEVAVGAE
ncbi:hypothetical protein [Natrononativus amylolyticus]|uniref:hypothetical protein n=1 Tax=Natrononativus amylolyticus TaxID=2963434 RepID=UPI0020CBA39B|nr:hypothetical protein [Natrononativus amylolyticus]